MRASAARPPRLGARMVWLDYLILVTLVLSTAFGIWRGFVKEALSLAAWVLAFWIALSFSVKLAAKLAPTVGSAAPVLAFVILFVGVLVVGAVVNHFVAKGIQAVGLQGFDRLLGGVFGMVRGVAVAALLLLFVGQMYGDRTDVWQRSKLVPYFKPVVGWLRSHLDHAPNFG
jgi:membrane protein required for colicin V production